MQNPVSDSEMEPLPDPEVFPDEGTGAEPSRYIGLLPSGVRTIAVISPASVPDPGHIRESMRMMERAGVRVKLGVHALEPAEPGMPSAPLAHRVEDFMDARNDPEVDMIICSRGGQGSLELIRKLDWEKMKKRPDLPFLGYSDITLILCGMLSRASGTLSRDRCSPGCGTCRPGASLPCGMPCLEKRVLPSSWSRLFRATAGEGFWRAICIGFL